MPQMSTFWDRPAVRRRLRMDTWLFTRISIIVGVIFLLGAIPSSADVDHSKDREIGNCLVRSYIDDFAEEIANILIMCNGDRDGGPIRVDFFPATLVAQVSLWDTQLGTSAWARDVTRIPEVVIRFDDRSAIRLRQGVWSDSTYGMGSFSIQSGLSEILDEMASAEKVRYRITYSKDYIGDVKEVHFPHEMADMVEEFVFRVKDSIER